MKKFLPYILILIILIGLSVPLVKVVAVDSLGTCTKSVPAGQQGPPSITSNQTEQQCKDAGGAWSAYYIFLAPLPCDTNANPLIPGCTDKGLLETFNPAGEGGGALGGYLNLMIKLFIGICAVLAVIMIVIGGIQYMTTELISSKEEGKKRIMGAIFGLLLALGAYTLLNTINPNLLNSDLSSLENVTVEVTLAEAIPEDTGTPPGATLGCTVGIQKTTINMFACGNIVQKTNTMLADSKLSGLNITGGGYRSTQQQFALRTKNCGAGNETNRAAKCKVLTALPGESNHNNGQAFDLKCDGTFIQTSDNKCFVWLKANGAKYGLYNLASEPWHWSVDGR